LVFSSLCFCSSLRRKKKTTSECSVESSKEIEWLPACSLVQAPSPAGRCSLESLPIPFSPRPTCLGSTSAARKSRKAKRVAQKTKLPFFSSRLTRSRRQARANASPQSSWNSARKKQKKKICAVRFLAAQTPLIGSRATRIWLTRPPPKACEGGGGRVGGNSSSQHKLGIQSRICIQRLRQRPGHTVSCSCQSECLSEALTRTTERGGERRAKQPSLPPLIIDTLGPQQEREREHIGSVLWVDVASAQSQLIG
jgi:hypothetical protein